MSSDTVEQIKERLSVLDVVAPYVKLTRAGKYHKGLCPFHKEKTPSFMVSPDRGFYHCFGCGKGGDMFTFIEEMEGMDFRGALKMLAEKAGVPLRMEPHGARDLKEKLYAAMEEAAGYFAEQLKGTPAALLYLKKRGLTDATIEAWRIGYAPPEWRALYDALTKAGYPEGVLLDAGLVKRPEGSTEQSAVSNQGAAELTDPSLLNARGSGAKRPYDRFRSRIVFPIMDLSGRVIGFSGRIFPDDEKSAKYLNSPETPLFDKSRVLYGLDAAREGIRKYGFTLLVEGQMDLLMAHQAGYTNAVALSGTAFTDGHAGLIKRYSEKLVLAFDGDRAGIAAAGRAGMLSLAAGLNVKLATLPSGEDPADLILRDPPGWREAVKRAVHVVDFYLAHIESAGYDARTFKLEVSRTVLPFIALIGNAIDREHFIGKVAAALSVPEEAVREEVKKIKSNEVRVTSEKKSTQHPAPSTQHAPEPFLSREDALERLLFGVAEALKDGSGAHSPVAEELGKRLEALVGAPRLESLRQSPDSMRTALIEGDIFLERHGGDKDFGVLVGEMADDLEREQKKSRYHDAVRSLKQAEAAGDHEKASELMRAVSVLAATLEGAPSPNRPK